MPYTGLLLRGEREIARALHLQDEIRSLPRRRTIAGGVDTDRNGDLHEAVRRKFAASTLPVARPMKLWVGKGRGDGVCAVCDQPIEEGALEYEPDFMDGIRIRFHQKCLGVWHEERARYLSASD